MANDVVIGAAMRQNLLSLQGTQRAIDSTQLRLATGKKVNSALDNPQSFFQAQSLNNRAGDLTRLLDGIGQSIRSIEQADKGITALTSLINQMDSVASEANSEMLAASGIATVTGTKDIAQYDDLVADSGGAITATTNTFAITVKETDGTSTTSADIAVAATDNVYNVAAKINASSVKDLVTASVDKQGRLKIESKEEGAALRITGGTANSLTSAGMEFLGLSGTVKTENTVATLRQGGTVIAGRTLSSNESTAAKVDGKFEASATLLAAGFVVGATTDFDATLNIDGDVIDIGQAYTVTSTIQDVVDGINNAGSDKVSASFNTKTGKIEMKFAESVGSASLNFDHDAAGRANFGFGTGAADNGVAAAAGNQFSEAFRFVGSSANLDQYTKDFNKLREQIDGIVKDANYRGVNLLGGDNLTTTFNEDRSNKLVTEGQDLTVEGMGIDKADFQDAASILKAVNQVSASLEQVRAFGSSLASDLSIIQTRRDFTEQTISTLKSGASDLTDAEQNEEGANLLALQTRQQLGVTSLSMASQSQQSVLRLF